VIAEHRRQQRAEHHPLPPEIQRVPTVPRAKGGLHDQALDPVVLHGTDHVQRALRADGRAARRARAKHDNRRVVAGHGGGHISGLQRVARMTAQRRMVDLQPLRAAGKGGDGVTGGQQFLHGKAADGSGSSKDDDVHGFGPFKVIS